MTAALTPQGLTIDTTEVILTSVVSQLRSTVSAGLSGSSASVAGQFAGITADALATVEQALQVVNGQFDPNNAEGAAADTICALTGVFRQGATPSIVPGLWCVFALSFAGAVPGALRVTVALDSTRQFVNSGTIPAGANAGAAFPFVCTETGPIAAPSGTLTALSSPPVGWTSATNATGAGGSGDAILGRLPETDAQLLARRVADLAASGTGPQPAIVRALLNHTNAVTGQPDITYAAVITNRTDFTDANNLPPHSVECLVWGSIAPSDLGSLILDNVAAGIAFYGTSFVNVVDASGNLERVYYTIPAPVTVYITVNLIASIATYGAGVQANGDASVAAFLNAWANGGTFGSVTFAKGYYQPGMSVVASRIIAQLFGTVPTSGLPFIPGLIDVPQGTTYIGLAPTPLSDATLPMTPGQYAQPSSSAGLPPVYGTFKIVSTLLP